jgi:hypothetical protein
MINAPSSSGRPTAKKVEQRNQYPELLLGLDIRPSRNIAFPGRIF